MSDMSLPNQISLSRIIFSGVFLYAVTDSNDLVKKASFLVGCIIIISDIVDGYIARRANLTTKGGYVLDGLGDRSFYIAFLLGIKEIWGIDLVLIYCCIIRDMCLYGIRSIYKDWYHSAEKNRILTKGYAISLRLVLGYYLVPFYYLLYRNEDIVLVPSGFLLVGNILFFLVIIFGFWSLISLYTDYSSQKKTSGNKKS